jgi:hypothetical protein
MVRIGRDNKITWQEPVIGYVYVQVDGHSILIGGRNHKRHKRLKKSSGFLEPLVLLVVSSPLRGS